MRTTAALRAARAALVGSVALVPTMGALHAGHLALVRAAAAAADHVIVSIFVNPLQFGAGEDLARYPRRETQDAAALSREGVALLWMPEVTAMYPDGFATTVSVADVSARFDGAHRPGHFDGVATVVAKLFGQVAPDVAWFGEKDWQQLAVVRRMVADLDLAVDVRGVATVRDSDGLALSSRNAYLSAEERARAAAFPAMLRRVAEDGVAAAEARAMLTTQGFAVDYLEVVDAALRPAEGMHDAERVLGAVRIGTTRLIDNMRIVARR